MMVRRSRIRAVWAAFALVATVAALALSSCGEQSDEDQIRAVAMDVQSAFEDGRLEDVCSRLTRAGRKQVVYIGHGIAGSCAKDLRTVASGVAKLRRKAGGEPPTVAKVVVRGRRATATVSVGGGARLTVPFAKEDGEWRVDGLYGGIPAGRQEDRF